jgi:hypothetical protein
MSVARERRDEFGLLHIVVVVDDDDDYYVLHEGRHRMQPHEAKPLEG